MIYTRVEDCPIFAYDLIMADPAWLFELRSPKGEAKSPQKHYDCMTIDEIAQLPVGHLAAKDCLLWLWATHPMLPQQIEVGRVWGFRYVTSGVWVKTTASGKLTFGPGYRLRSASEPFLIFTNGNPETVRDVRTVVVGERREHSRKPEEAYATAERLVPGDVRRLDLFSRQERPGWDACGDQTGKFAA